MKIKITPLGGWVAAQQALSADLGKAVRTALAQEAEFLADKVREKLKVGPHTPLSPLTLRARRLGIGGSKFRGTKPLLRTGDLRNSIAAIPDAQGLAYFIGIPRSARSRDGQYLVRLADVHERGRTIVIKLTPKVARFLFGVLLKGAPKRGGSSPGGPGKTKILVIHIPARPFIGPAFAAWSPTSGQRFMATLERLFAAAKRR